MLQQQATFLFVMNLFFDFFLRRSTNYKKTKLNIRSLSSFDLARTGTILPVVREIILMKTIENFKRYIPASSECYKAIEIFLRRHFFHYFKYLDFFKIKCKFAFFLVF